ncbi:MAG: glucose PTS transporter subunit IIA [Mobilicoccus sp.]|nr:glucose PTS transporter subunit IIA [Mobilicoccus sp.]
MSTTPTDTSTPRRTRGRGFGGLQRFGKSLMLPIALLPAAGLLLRIGQEDVLGWITAPVIGPFLDAMTAAGDNLFGNLAFLFAVGIAIGMAKKADGSTALAAVAGYLVIEATFAAMSPVVLEGQVNQVGDPAEINFGIFAGIVVGLITAKLYDRYHDIELPTYLGFFGGRRFVPIVVSFTTLIVGFGMSYLYPLFDMGLTAVSDLILAGGALGAFAYGFINRMLIPFGLHHLVNVPIWFMHGSYESGGQVVQGEITRFAAGDPTAGVLTAGFYPILMFGLPAAALAMMHVARPEQKKLAAGILGAAGLTAFITGITEPLEFAFMFVAFPLYVIHALLTGLSMAIAYLLDIHLAFSFSAGLIDLLLYGGAPAASNIGLLVVMGLVFFVLYYVLFRFAIVTWNLRTPGRGGALETGDDTAGAQGSDQAHQLIEAFGGRDNLSYVDACITRLRIEVADKGRVDKDRLRALGAAGVMEVGNNVQAVFGPRSENLRDDIRAALGSEPARTAPVAATGTQGGGTATATRTGTILSPVDGTTLPLESVPDDTFAQGLVGHGVAIDPPRRVVVAVAPIAGEIVQLWPHAYAIRAEDGTGVLVHLGLDTVSLDGAGFTTHADKGDHVAAGQAIVTYDVVAVERAGRNPVVPVVVMDRAEGITTTSSGEVSLLDPLLTVN